MLLRYTRTDVWIFEGLLEFLPLFAVLIDEFSLAHFKN